MLLYIIRHGDPDYKQDCLNAKGKREAEAVARRMCQVRPNRIFTSPMGRAIETAMPTCELLKKEPTVLEWAHEVEDERLTTFPDGKKRSVTYVPNFYYRTEKNIDLSFDDSFQCDGFSDSGMKAAYERIAEGGRGFLDELGYKEENGIYRIIKPNEEKIALFCHSVMGRCWISHLLHIPVHMMWSSFAYSFTGVTVIHFKNYEEGFTAPKCLSYCDLGHLYEDRQGMSFENEFYI